VLAQARSDRSNVIPLRQRRLPLAPAYGVAAVAAAVAIGFGFWISSLSHSLDRERAARRAPERALSLLTQPGSREAELSGARGLLVRQRSGAAALIVSALPAAPSGKTYEAWVTRGGVPPEPAGIFHGGGRLTVFVLERPVVGFARVLVTLERAEGASTPSGKSVFGTAANA
jgi:Anti-sigma-K factor rskA